MRSSAAPVGVTRSIGGPAAYTGASPSSASVAGAGTGSVPCWHFTVPLPTFKRRRHPAIDAQRLASRRRAHNIDDRVHRAHLVKVHLLDGNGVNRRLRLAQQLKGARRALLHRSGSGAA